MIRGRFILGVLLVLLTVAAIGFGVYRFYRLDLSPRERAAWSITVGMSQAEVMNRLGNADSITPEGRGVTWGYVIGSAENPTKGFLHVEFESPTGVVSKVRRTDEDVFAHPK